MALNKVILAGIVTEEPDFIVGAIHNNALEVKLSIHRQDIGKTENISFLIFNPKLITRALNEIHEGSYVYMTGRIITTNYIKTLPVVCSHCQNVEYRQTQAECTEIETFDFSVMEVASCENSIGINKVFLLGNVCSNLNFRPGANNGRDYVKYKLAVNRPRKEMERIKNQNPDIEKAADFPFIVSFNNEATMAQKHLQQSALVIIEGAIQQREIRQKQEFYCPVCNQESTPHIRSTVREVITAKANYLTLGAGQKPQLPEENESIEIENSEFES